METLVLDSAAVERSLGMAPLIDAVEDAFAAYGRGDVVMPAKSYITLVEYNGDFRAMPSYVDAGDWEAAAIKWVNVHPDNPAEHDLPTVMGTVIYSDPASGFPLALIDGTSLTRLRTGAAAAVATDHLAPEGASSLGLVGAGRQAYTQLRAIAAVRPIERVVVKDVDEHRTEAFVEHFADEYDVSAGSTEEAASCEILSTVTPVREPIVSPDMLGPTTHVNAMGADAEGKQELETEILRMATVVIDDYEQTTHSGEINVPWRNGDIADGDIHGELGAVVTGRRSVERGGGVTVFDSTGLAIQDAAAAHLAYSNARSADEGISLPFTDVDPDDSA